MKFGKPEMRAGHQEALNFVAPVVENMGAPFLMVAQARVFVLIQRRTVEARQRPVVRGKVRRHPVEDHTDASLVKSVDQMAQIIGRAKTAGGSEIAGGLVTP